ncbi:MAG: DUF2283 domain-containing protein [archaeon]|jgi:uncharacterized protein YuzE
MDINYDKEADAVYIRLKKGTVAKTKKIDDITLIDLDKTNDVLGMELLNASKRIPQKSLFEVHVKNLALIMAK